MPFLFICKGGPSGFLGAAIGIGLSALTGFMDGGLLAKTSVSATATQLTLGTLSNNFNPVKAVEDMATAQGLKSLGVNVATSVLAGPTPGLNATLPQITTHAAKISLIRGSLNVTLGRESFNEALKNAGMNFLFDVVGRVGANQIGQMYQNGNGEIGYGTHKLLHGAFGAGLGAFKGDPLAGAIGGMVSEMVAEALVDKEEIILDRVLEKAEMQGIEVNSEQFYGLIADETRTAMEFGKLGAALSVALAGRDINVGMDVATNAVENNFAPMVYVALLAGGQALSLLNTVLTTVDAVEAYEKNGVEGVKHLISEDAALAMSTGGLGKPTLKIKNLLQKLKAFKLKEAPLKHVNPEPMGINLDGVKEPKGKGRAVDVDKQLVLDYSTPEAPFSLRIDPFTGKGPMSVDSNKFTIAKAT